MLFKQPVQEQTVAKTNDQEHQNMDMEKTIEDCQNWLRLTVICHSSLKESLLNILHNASNDSRYVGLPRDPTLLYHTLNKKFKKRIVKLCSQSILSPEQFLLLFPPYETETHSKHFDVTLIVTLIRNCTNLPAPVGGWQNHATKSYDMSTAAFVVRARKWRNVLYHTDPRDIDKEMFDESMSKAEEIIKGLKGQQTNHNLHALKTCSLDSKTFPSKETNGITGMRISDVETVFCQGPLTLIHRLKCKLPWVNNEQEQTPDRANKLNFSNAKTLLRESRACTEEIIMAPSCIPLHRFPLFQRK